MFAWFQRLLPERGDFFGMFEAHAAMIVAAAEALQQLAVDVGSTEECLNTIQDREHIADDVIRDVLTTVRRTREILRHLEKVTDAFEDVANQIDGIVIENA